MLFADILSLIVAVSHASHVTRSSDNTIDKEISMTFQNKERKTIHVTISSENIHGKDNLK